MGSKGGGSTTSNTIAEPWEGAQPVLRELLEGTTGAYRAGMFDIPSYPGIRVAPQSNMTQTAQQGFYDTATGWNPYAAGAQFGFGEAMAGPGAGLGGLGLSDQAVGFFGNPANTFGGMGAANQAMGFYGNPANTYGGLGAAGQMLGQFGGGMPDLSAVHENILGSVVPSTAHLFGQSGMLDSTNAQDTVGRAAASALAPFDYGAYENAQNRAMSAHQMASQLEAQQWNQAMGMGLSAFGLGAPLESQQWNQAMNTGLSAYGLAAPMEQNAYEAARQRQMQALGMSPDLMRSRYMDPMMLGAAGLNQDQYHQALLDAAQGQWYEEGNRPYDNLQRAASLALGFGGMGEQRTSEQDQPGGSVFGQILQAASFPLHMAIKSSDRRLKRDILRIGSTAEGYAKYLFRYLWSNRWHVGVMAQEVPPEITLRGPDGFLMVDYSKVRF